MIILHILLFILCLSVLVVIHELGHLAAAKAFGVYCFEFSVGFGPALFRKKRKRGETYIAIRSIPFGGYVSMYGENENDTSELPDGIENIDPKRSLANVKKWKKAIIMAAGVFLNAVLALVLFFISNSCFEQQIPVYLNFNVIDNSPASTAGLVVDVENPYTTLYVGWNDINNLDKDTNNLSEEAKVAGANGFYIVSKDGIITYEDGTNLTVAVIIDKFKFTIKNRDYVDLFRYFPIEDNKINYMNEVKINASSSEKAILSLDFTLTTCSYGEDEIATDIKGYSIHLDSEVEGKTVRLEDSGVQMYLHTYWNNFGQAISKTGKDFGKSSVMIFEALGGLFVGKGWDSVGGPIAIFTESTSTLQNFGASYFIQLWAIISVNLAIFNLIPFPGLDGWHLLVLAIEGITRKKLPEKAKSIASFVGMVLLFGLMILIVIKDIFGLF